MQQFDITVATVGSFVVHSPGRYIKYVSGSNGGSDASLIISPGGQGGSKIVLFPGQAYRVADNKPTPDSWTLLNAAGIATILGKVVVGDGRIDDSTITGNVNIIDNNKAQTLSNLAFMITGYSAAVAAVYAECMLWNPAGSGKNIYVQRAGFSSTGGATSAAVMLFRNSTTGLTQGANSLSKLSGGANGVGQIWTGTQAAQPVGGLVSLSQNASLPETQPICIVPGWGMAIVNNTVNQDCAISVESIEQ